MTKREILLKQISSYAFAIYELKLFLDTHPADIQTLQKISQLEAKLKPLREEYVSNFGPLTSNDSREDYWSWVNDPWPWEGV